MPKAFLARHEFRTQPYNMINGSLFVKTHHYTRIFYARLSQRAALTGTAPTHKASGRVFFYNL